MERDRLALELHDEGTLPLAAVVELISEWPDGRKAIHVRVADERYWARFPGHRRGRPPTSFR